MVGWGEGGNYPFRGWQILIHNCSSCTLAEIWFEEDGSDVYLNLNRVATEEDLESDHNLEYERRYFQSLTSV